MKDAVGHYRTQFYNGISFQNRLLICPDHHVNVRVRIRVVVSCIPVQRRRWEMKGFGKFVLLADKQLPPSRGIVITKPLRVLAMQRVYDRPNVSVVRGQVVHRRSQIRIFLPPEQAVRAMLFRAGARSNVLEIAVFGLKILHM